MTNRPHDAFSRSSYWETVHDGKAVDAVSWWQSEPTLSLSLVDEAAPSLHDPIIDVGAGWSTLMDYLVARGHTDVTAIDLSGTALRTVRERLGPAGAHVMLEVADVMAYRPSRRFALWHDRAVFHFLTEPDERADYLSSLAHSLAPGGWVVVATFGPDGPTTCSGLPIIRYTHNELAAEFGASYDVVATAGEDHLTPWGSAQQFTAVLLRHRGQDLTQR